MFGVAEEPLPFGWWFLAAGAVLLGVAIWFGTSGEALIRVGDAGIGVEKGGTFGTLPLRYMAWYALENIDYEGADGSIVAKGKDEAGVPLAVRARIASHPQAAAWIVKEARSRVPSIVHVGEAIELPKPRGDAGESILLDPLRIVGKRCAESGMIIAFEPDGRVCPRCERVYHKDHVPPTCPCGADLKASGSEEAPASSPEQAEAAPAQPSPSV